MRKRRLSITKRILRMLIISLPYLYTIRRMIIDEIDNRLQKFVIYLLDKYNLHDYERIEPTEKYEML